MPRGKVNSDPAAVEKRRLASGLDALKKKILTEERFWVDNVDLDTTLAIRSTIESAITNRKQIIAQKALDQLKALGVSVPKNFEIKFAE